MLQCVFYCAFTVHRIDKYKSIESVKILHSEEHLCKSPACRAAQSGCQQFCVLLVEDAKEPGVHGGQGIENCGFGPGHRGSSVSLQHGGQVGLIST